MSASRHGKGIFYGLSTLPGLSRINDDVHYFSQAALGWYLAYLSCAAIEKTEDQREDRVHFGISPIPNGLAITAWKYF